MHRISPDGASDGDVDAIHRQSIGADITVRGLWALRYLRAISRPVLRDHDKHWRIQGACTHTYVHGKIEEAGNSWNEVDAQRR